MFSKVRTLRVVVGLAVLMLVSVVVVAAAPLCHITISTTVSASTVPLNNPVYDNVKITTNEYSGAFNGKFDFWVCFSTTTYPDCTSGGTFVGSTSKTVNNLTPNTTYTNFVQSPAFKPTAAGKYCFRVLYTKLGGVWDPNTNPDIGGPYNTSECFKVLPLTFTTNLGTSAGPFSGPGPYPITEGLSTYVNDIFSISGSGTIQGTLTSFYCKTTPSTSTPPACSTGGTPLSPITTITLQTLSAPDSQTQSANTVHTFTSASFQPGLLGAGTYCFRTEFAATGGTIPSLTHVGGGSITQECVTVSSVTDVTLSTFQAQSSDLTLDNIVVPGIAAFGSLLMLAGLIGAGYVVRARS
jgi:hypothetical protein